MIDLLAREATTPGWHDAAAYWGRLTDAVSDVSGPCAVVELDALRHNALDMLVRARGVPIRIATKSVRVREVLDATLALPGYAGLLAYTLPEALWLAEAHDDIVVGYPSADRAALARLAAEKRQPR